MKYVIGLHRITTPTEASMMTQLGVMVSADGKSIQPVLVSPGTPIRTIQEEEPAPGPEEIKRVPSGSGAEIGTGPSAYSYVLVGEYKDGANTLSSEGADALRALKTVLDQVKANEPTHIILDGNFGYSSFNVGVALVAKDYLDQKLGVANTNKIKMTIMGGGGSEVENKETAIQSIQQVFGIDISQNPARYFVSPAAAQKLLPKPGSGQGVGGELFAVARTSISKVVGTDSAERRRERKLRGDHAGKGGSRTPTPKSGLTPVAEFPDVLATSAPSSAAASSSSSALIISSLAALSLSASSTASSTVSSTPSSAAASLPAYPRVYDDLTIETASTGAPSSSVASSASAAASSSAAAMWSGSAQASASASATASATASTTAPAKDDSPIFEYRV